MEKKRVYDLLNEVDYREFRDGVNIAHSSLDEYLERKKTATVLAGYPVFSKLEGPYFAVIGNIVYSISDTWTYQLDKDLSLDHIQAKIPSAVFVQCHRKQILVQNGDEQGDPGPDWYVEDERFPTVSFECIRRLYPEKYTVHDIASWLASGSLRVLDYTLDDRRSVTAKEEKLIEKGEIHKLQGPVGYTLMSREGYWHRSGTLLLHDTDLGQYYLLGQDEGTYFGVQLPRRARTVEEAYTVLTPVEARGVKGVQRQGEWFAVPVDEKDVPGAIEAIALLTDEGSDTPNVALPVDNVDSNRHILYTTNGRIMGSGQIYAHNPSLTHNEHAELSLVGWYTFYRNTAVRSVSVQGVD